LYNQDSKTDAASVLTYMKFQVFLMIFFAGGLGTAIVLAPWIIIQIDTIDTTYGLVIFLYTAMRGVTCTIAICLHVGIHLQYLIAAKVKAHELSRSSRSGVSGTGVTTTATKTGVSPSKTGSRDMEENVGELKNSDKSSDAPDSPGVSRTKFIKDSERDDSRSDELETKAQSDSDLTKSQLENGAQKVSIEKEKEIENKE